MAVWPSNHRVVGRLDAAVLRSTRWPVAHDLLGPVRGVRF